MNFNSCRSRLWQHRDFMGDMIDFVGGLSGIEMEVGSIQWS